MLNTKPLLLFQFFLEDFKKYLIFIPMLISIPYWGPTLPPGIIIWTILNLQ